MMIAVYDIETGPVGWEEMQEFLPEFSAPSNWKDEKKIEEEIRKKQEDWKRKAALRPTTAKVLAIGWLSEDVEILWMEGTEPELLGKFWRKFEEWVFHQNNILFGFYNKEFDLPFLVARSQKWGIPYPAECADRYFIMREPRHRDIVDFLQMELKQSSLDTVAKFLGTENRKTGKGEDFAMTLSLDKEVAKEYLRNDLRLTLEVANKLYRL